MTLTSYRRTTTAYGGGTHMFRTATPLVRAAADGVQQSIYTRNADRLATEKQTVNDAMELYPNIFYSLDAASKSEANGQFPANPLGKTVGRPSSRFDHSCERNPSFLQIESFANGPMSLKWAAGVGQANGCSEETNIILGKPNLYSLSAELLLCDYWGKIDIPRLPGAFIEQQFDSTENGSINLSEAMTLYIPNTSISELLPRESITDVKDFWLNTDSTSAEQSKGTRAVRARLTKRTDPTIRSALIFIVGAALASGLVNVRVLRGAYWGNGGMQYGFVDFSAESNTTLTVNLYSTNEDNYSNGLAICLSRRAVFSNADSLMPAPLVLPDSIAGLFDRTLETLRGQRAN